eukprot:TRINITY_DN104347_c0_g1_i1.p1 TRINITY_DN104347_c0_g1~~TRINITY_DN104347_c0_g1_i1.p1  ORF type:complete len:902 (-),score=273.03 TRINITY_DN104347_c0_g1_i1:96-2744(-)
MASASAIGDQAGELVACIQANRERRVELEKLLRTRRKERHKRTQALDEQLATIEQEENTVKKQLEDLQARMVVAEHVSDVSSKGQLGSTPASPASGLQALTDVAAAVRAACREADTAERQYKEAFSEETIERQRHAEKALGVLKAELVAEASTIAGSDSGEDVGSLADVETELKRIEELKAELERRMQAPAAAQAAKPSQLDMGGSSAPSNLSSLPPQRPPQFGGAPEQPQPSGAAGAGPAGLPDAKGKSKGKGPPLPGSLGAASTMEAAIATGKAGKGSGKAPPPPFPGAAVAADSGSSGKGKAPPVGKGAGGKSVPPPPMAAPGKGKGGDKGKGTGKPAGGKGAAGAVVRRNQFVNLHWKVINQPPGEDAKKLARPLLDEFRRQQSLWADAESLPEALPTAAGDKEAKELSPPLAERSVLLASATEAVPAKLDWVELIESNPTEWQSCFATSGSEGATSSQEFPQGLLEKFFKVREAAKKIQGSADGTGEKKKKLLDDKSLQVLGITLRKYLMVHKTETEAEAVMALKRGFLRCDYDVCGEEAVAMIRYAMNAEAGREDPCAAHAKEHGAEALDSLSAPACHRLYWEIYKIPQWSDRVECILFETGYKDSLKRCQDGLQVMRSALSMLVGKKPMLRKLFSTALKLGNDLNRGSSKAQQLSGFSLQSLKKLLSIKSTRDSQYDMMHFSLALMKPDEAASLFSLEDQAMLSKAKTLKTYTVYQDCQDLASTFQGIKALADTGKLKTRNGKEVPIEKRRRTMAKSGPVAEAEFDDDDVFIEHFKGFVRHHVGEVQAVSHGLLRVLELYKDLAIFFEDLASVWPPPKNDSDPKMDLMNVMYQLAGEVHSRSIVVQKDRLRENLQQRQQEMHYSSSQGAAPARLA